MFGICVAIGQFCIVCHFEMSEKLFSGCMTSLKCRSMQKMGKKTCKHFLCIFVWTIILDSYLYYVSVLFLVWKSCLFNTFPIAYHIIYVNMDSYLLPFAISTMKSLFRLSCTCLHNAL